MPVTHGVTGSSPVRTAPATGGLAQLARAPALQAGGQRFESVILHKYRLTYGKDNSQLSVIRCQLDEDL